MFPYYNFQDHGCKGIRVHDDKDALTHFKKQNSSTSIAQNKQQQL
jgi:hypothetical protein